jgi:hypothetical protein
MTNEKRYRLRSYRRGRRPQVWSLSWRHSYTLLNSALQALHIPFYQVRLQKYPTVSAF